MAGLHFVTDNGRQNVGLVHQRFLYALKITDAQIVQNPVNGIEKTNDEDNQIAEKNTASQFHKSSFKA
jgi:hypothetical protein